ncbi:MAG TPA: LysR family transcriptional regulator [Polyangia bacterium]|nr:LysR family transcriptional regulator [Polyangia bacterium]
MAATSQLNLEYLFRLWNNRCMADLNEMMVFARVVQVGSFTAAATALGMPKSTVSRKVAELEDRLKSRLLNRTTRRLSLTDVGRTYYDHCARIAGEIEDAERAVSSLQEAPRGLLRITTGTNAMFLAPIFTDYLKRYPEVRMEILATGRLVDLVEERFDLAVRAGALADSTLVARSLGSARWFLVASPGYLKKRGRPETPADVKQHDVVWFGASAAGASLRLHSGDQATHLTVPVRMVANDLDLCHAGALAGLGIALLPAFFCVRDLRAGKLERVLRDWDAPQTPIQVIYPSTRHISPKVKSFVEHVQARMTPPPWEVGPMP